MRRLPIYQPKGPEKCNASICDEGAEVIQLNVYFHFFQAEHLIWEGNDGYLERMTKIVAVFAEIVIYHANSNPQASLTDRSKLGSPFCLLDGWKWLVSICNMCVR